MIDNWSTSEPLAQTPHPLIPVFRTLYPPPPPQLKVWESGTICLLGQRYTLQESENKHLHMIPWTVDTVDKNQC